MGADLEDGRRAGPDGGAARILLPAEAAVEEAGVVVPELAETRVHGQHLGREVGGDPQALPAGEDVEAARRQQALPAGGLDRLEPRARVVGALGAERHGRSEGGRAPARGLAPLEADRELEAALGVEAQLVGPERAISEEAQGLGRCALTELLRGELRAATREPNLAEPVPGAQAHGEREGADLEVEVALPAGRGLVEARVAADQDAREQVEPSAGGARVEARAHALGEAQAPRERHEVDAASLEDRALAGEVEHLAGEVLDLLAHGAAAREEACEDAVGRWAEAQVQAGRLDRGVLQALRAGSRGEPVLEVGLELVVDEDAFGCAHGGILQPGAPLEQVPTPLLRGARRATSASQAQPRQHPGPALSWASARG